jgi:hypothetical protein
MKMRILLIQGRKFRWKQKKSCLQVVIFSLVNKRKRQLPKRLSPTDYAFYSLLFHMNTSFLFFFYDIYPFPFSFLEHFLFIQVVKRSELISNITKSIVLVSVKGIDNSSLNWSEKSTLSLKAIQNKPYHHYNLMEDQNPKKKLVSGHFIPCVGYGTYQLRGEDCSKGVRWAL